jgi:ABC-type polar amino acid transport system ATPase subunit
MKRKDAEELAMHFLTKVRIAEQAGKYPGQLQAASSNVWRSPVRSA